MKKIGLRWEETLPPNTTILNLQVYNQIVFSRCEWLAPMARTSESSSLKATTSLCPSHCRCSTLGCTCWTPSTKNWSASICPTATTLACSWTTSPSCALSPSTESDRRPTTPVCPTTVAVSSFVCRRQETRASALALLDTGLKMRSSVSPTGKNSHKKTIIFTLDI